MEEGRTQMQNKYGWAGFSIAAMWVAVMIVAICGGEFRTESISDTMEIPIVLMVAALAMIGTIAVAVLGFRK